MLTFIKRQIRYLVNLINYANHCRFYYSSHIGTYSSFEGANLVGKKSSFTGSMGYASALGEHSSLVAQIGRFTSIASYVRCNLGKHPYTYPYATTCPAFYSRGQHLLIRFADKQKYDEYASPIQVGSDCWIGEGAFIVGGVKIGDGAVVLAHAVVTKDVPPYAIVGGVPAKVIKYRYDAGTVEFLLSVKWWMNDMSWMKEHWNLLCDIDSLKQYYKNR